MGGFEPLSAAVANSAISRVVAGEAICQESRRYLKSAPAHQNHEDGSGQDLQVIPKPSEFAEAAGRGIGTGLFSLLGTSIVLYVSLLALLRSHKRNSPSAGQTQTQVSPGLSGQAYQARVTRGLNAYEPPGRAENQGSGGGGVRLDEVVGGAGVGFVPGSPTEAMASARPTFSRGGANEHGSSADDNDPDIVDVEEVR